ncbi:MAG: protein arginine kinase [Firmicutes bacterium]|nr:protein arginine kinase [Bacillota bacterium]
MSVEPLFATPLGKSMKNGATDPVVLTSRIRLARNIADLPFPTTASAAQSEEVIRRATQAFHSSKVAQLGRFQLLRLRDLTPLQRQVLVEKHLESPQHIQQQVEEGAIAVREDEAISVLINEEDHLRIQVIRPSLSLREAWTLADQMDNALEATIDYAYDERLGYLTTCPTNLGTAMRASVMVHLPALVFTQQIRRVLTALQQVGLVARGLYGEGTEAVGNLFQISNQVTLGRPEEDMIDNLTAVVQQLTHQEQQAREALLHQQRIEMEDRVHRAYGVLAHCRKISSQEAMEMLSLVRFGIDTGLLKGSPKVFDEGIVLCQPGFVQLTAGRELDSNERDIRRAELLRARVTAREG